MNWPAYFAVCSAVISVGLALGLTLPLVSLRLTDWGYGQFAVGVMAAMPALGVLFGARLSAALAKLLGTPRAMQLSLMASAMSVALLAVLEFYPLWLLLRLLIGIALTVVFVLGESWINQLVEERLRGRLVALYGTGFALSQLFGPLLLGLIGSEGNQGFWLSTGLLFFGGALLLGRSGAPLLDEHGSGRGLWRFCLNLPAIAWAVALFAAFESMVLTLLPLYLLGEGFAREAALFMVSVVVLGDALLQLPLGLLADKVSRSGLLRACGGLLLASCLLLPVFLHSLWRWPLLVLFGATAGGLYTLALILIGQYFRDAELVRANSHIAQLWGFGCLLGPLLAGAGSQWLSGQALPALMALGTVGFLLVLWRRPLPA